MFSNNNEYLRNYTCLNIFEILLKFWHIYYCFNRFARSFKPITWSDWENSILTSLILCTLKLLCGVEDIKTNILGSTQSIIKILELSVRAEKRKGHFSFWVWSGLFSGRSCLFFHQMASFGPLYNSGGVAVDFFGLRLCFNTLIANWPEDFLRKWTKYSLGE